MRFTLTQFFYLFLFTSLTSCAGKPPLREYLLSHVAIESAQTAQAQQLARKYLHMSQTLYDEALRFYEERKYNKAKELFEQSRYYAEQAELRARVIKRKKGEAFL